MSNYLGLRGWKDRNENVRKRIEGVKKASVGRKKPRAKSMVGPANINKLLGSPAPKQKSSPMGTRPTKPKRPTKYERNQQRIDAITRDLKRLGG